MKKLIAFIVIFGCIILTLASCGGSGSNGSVTSSGDYARAGGIAGYAY